MENVVISNAVVAHNTHSAKWKFEFRGVSSVGRASDF